MFRGRGLWRRKGQCSGGQCDGVNARLWGAVGEESRVQGKSTVVGRAQYQGGDSAGFPLPHSDIMANSQTERTQLG